MVVNKQEALEAHSVAIRTMHDADLAAVVRIEQASYTFPWSEGIFRDCLRVNYVCRVIEVDGKIAGYGILSLGAGEAHVLNLCIAAEHRCRGVGRRLLTHLLQVSQHLGAREVLLETRPSNAAALRLYRSLGFTPIGTRRGYYQAVGGREDAVVLRHDIG